MNKETCEKYHYHWNVIHQRVKDAVTGEIQELGKHTTCLIDRKPHPIADKCDYWEDIISVHDNQRLEDARIKRMEVAWDKRYFKGILLGAVIGMSGPILLTIIDWGFKLYQAKITALISP